MLENLESLILIRHDTPFAMVANLDKGYLKNICVAINCVRMALKSCTLYMGGGSSKYADGRPAGGPRQLMHTIGLLAVLPEIFASRGAMKFFLREVAECF